MIQISVNTQGLVNGHSSGSTAPVAGADLLITTRIVIQYYSDNMNIFPILLHPQTWNFLRAAQGSQAPCCLASTHDLALKATSRII